MRAFLCVLLCSSALYGQVPTALVRHKTDLNQDGIKDELRVLHNGSVVAHVDKTFRQSAPIGTFRSAVIGEAKPGLLFVTLTAAKKRKTGLVIQWKNNTLYTVTTPLGQQGKDATYTLSAEVKDGAIYTYQMRNGFDTCHQSEKLFPQAYDPNTQQFRPIYRSAPPATKMRHGRTHKGKPVPGLLFQPAAASSSLNAYHAGHLVAPGQLNDGDISTEWSEGMPGDGRNEFVTFRSQNKHIVQKILLGRQLPPPHRGNKNQSAHQLEQIDILINKKRYSYHLPKSQWISFPLPNAGPTSCIAVFIRQTSAKRGGGITSIGELNVLTRQESSPEKRKALFREELKRRTGSPKSTARWIATFRDSEDIFTLTEGLPKNKRALLLIELVPLVEELTRKDPRLLPTLLDGYHPAQSPSEKKRILEFVLELQHPQKQEKLRELLARHPDPFLRKIVFQATLDPSMIEELVQDLTVPSKKLHAFTILSSTPQSHPLLFKKFATSDARHPTDASLVTLLLRARYEPMVSAALVTFTSTTQLDDLSPILLSGLRWVSPSDLKTLPTESIYASARGDSPLHVATRRELLRLIQKHKLPPLPRSLHDTDPEVRALAIATVQPSLKRALQALAKEPWPIVQKQWLSTVRKQCKTDSKTTLSPLWKVFHDRRSTRLEALQTLKYCDTHTPKKILPLLGKTDYLATVGVQMINLIGETGQARFRKPMRKRLREFHNQASYNPKYLPLAISAVQAVAELGGPGADDALIRVAQDRRIPRLQAAAIAGLGILCPYDAQHLFREAMTMKSPVVVTAAQRASLQCKKSP